MDRIYLRKETSCIYFVYDRDHDAEYSTAWSEDALYEASRRAAQECKKYGGDNSTAEVSEVDPRDVLGGYLECDWDKSDTPYLAPKNKSHEDLEDFAKAQLEAEFLEKAEAFLAQCKEVAKYVDSDFAQKIVKLTEKKFSE